MGNQSVGSYLKEYRQRMGVSQKELAECAGVSQAAISLIEKGDRTLSFEAAHALAQSHDLNLLSLLGIEQPDCEQTLQSMWAEYDKLHDKFHALVDRLEEVHEVLTPMDIALKARATRAGHSKAIDLILDRDKLNRLRWQCPPKAKLPAYQQSRIMVHGSNPESESGKLLSLIDGLRADDREVIVRLISRITEQKES